MTHPAPLNSKWLTRCRPHPLAHHALQCVCVCVKVNGSASPPVRRSDRTFLWVAVRSRCSCERHQWSDGVADEETPSICLFFFYRRQTSPHRCHRH
ncbi:hypothetical protein C0Q70_01694 [Pomacea canaliculata]|uniref:Uncharacterized protein n=1 Tax=Pomacea canaliculata TaxID=400727 RepID=A0A2T7Q062_POMCA|nr:hypothetical protein C0Q70_01694 [Pomacea canaliculata]